MKRWRPLPEKAHVRHGITTDHRHYRWWVCAGPRRAVLAGRQLSGGRLSTYPCCERRTVSVQFGGSPRTAGTAKLSPVIAPCLAGLFREPIAAFSEGQNPASRLPGDFPACDQTATNSCQAIGIADVLIRQPSVSRQRVRQHQREWISARAIKRLRSGFRSTQRRPTFRYPRYWEAERANGELVTND